MACSPKKQCSCCFRLKTIIILAVLGIVLIVLGVILRPIIDNIFHTKIDENLVLAPDKPTYKPWHKSSIPIQSEYYFFDILNPDEVKRGEKPFVQERGPYIYTAHTEKNNITWHNGNATVSYDDRTWFDMVDNSSRFSHNPFIDEITTVNIPLIVVAEIMKTYPDYLHWKLAVSELLASYSEGLFVTRKVHDLLWGYEDQLLVEFAKLRDEHPILKLFIPKVDTTVRLQPNNTLQGRTNIRTGEKDIKNVQKWVYWKGKDNAGIWLTKYANMLNGTDGRQFAPWLSKSDTIYFITIQLCRSLYVTYDHEINYRDINVYRFTIPQKLFLNGSVEPDNAAFFPQGFLPTGLLDPRKCQGGKVSAPIFLSSPHFYLGDPTLVNAVRGVNPEKEKHELYFDIEPTLGSPLRNAIRLQINAFIESVKDITETSGVKKVYMPVMWFQESAVIDTDTTDLFRDDILIPIEICHYVEIAMICIGSLLFITELLLLCCVVRKRKKPIMCCCYVYEEQKPILQVS